MSRYYDRDTRDRNPRTSVDPVKVPGTTVREFIDPMDRLTFAALFARACENTGAELPPRIARSIGRGPEYAARVHELEGEGCTTSDAQAVADAEFML